MARYTKEETLRIEYFKSRIREARYLEYELFNTKSKIEEIDYKLSRISNQQSRKLKKYTIFKTDEKWNKLIQEKSELTNRVKLIDKELNRIENILNSLTSKTKNISIDLLVRKLSTKRICDKYYISNPYQTINDELRYLDIDNF